MNEKSSKVELGENDLIKNIHKIVESYELLLKT